MAIRSRTFPGGYAFRRFAGRPEDSLVEAPLPSKALLPLRSAAGADLPALVKTRETVKAGQAIARDEASGALVMATVSGQVEELKPAAWLGGKTNVATIIADGSPDWLPLEGHTPDWRHATAEALRGLIARAGAAALPASASRLVVQAAEDEPYNPSPAVLVKAWGLEALVEGLGILSRALPGAALHLAFRRDRRALAARVEGAARKAGLEVRLFTVSGKYPQAHPAVLAPTLFGKGLEAGTAVFDLQTVLQVRDAVVLGKPAIERVVALAGTGFAARPHLRVRVGFPAGELAQPYLRAGRESRLVINSLLGGAALAAQAPLPPQASVLVAVPENKEGELLSFASPGFASDSRSLTFAASLLPFAKRTDTNLHGEGRACISCGFCEDVCPARILPQILHRYVKKNVIDETLVRFRIFRCIDCNLCSYVCTSKIPLARLMREGKEKLAKEGLAPREVGA